MPLIAVKIFEWLMNLPWKKMLPYIALAVALAFAYFYGLRSGEHKADVRIAAYEKQINDAAHKIETLQATTNTKIVTEYKDRVQVIYKTRDDNASTIQTSVKSTGQMTQGWVYSADQSALGLKIDSTKAAIAEASDVSDVQALLTMNQNYATCNAELARFSALQQWIYTTQANINKANK